MPRPLRVYEASFSSPHGPLPSCSHCNFLVRATWCCEYVDERRLEMLAAQIPPISTAPEDHHTSSYLSDRCTFPSQYILGIIQHFIIPPSAGYIFYAFSIILRFSPVLTSVSWILLFVINNVSLLWDSVNI